MGNFFKMNISTCGISGKYTKKFQQGICRELALPVPNVPTNVPTTHIKGTGI